MQYNSNTSQYNSNTSQYNSNTSLTACRSTDPDELDVVVVAAFRWHGVVAAGGELELGLCDDMGIIKVTQDSQQTAAVPVVGDTTPIVTLPCHVADGIKGNFVVLIDEHLGTKVLMVRAVIYAWADVS